MDRPSIKEQTLGISHEEAVNDQEAIRPGVTTRMVMLSLFIGLIGWVFNFDLQVGHLKFAPKNANLTRSSLLRDLYKFFNS